VTAASARQVTPECIETKDATKKKGGGGGGEE